MGFQILQVSLAAGESYQALQGTEIARTGEKELWETAPGNVVGKEGKGEAASSREEVQEQKVNRLYTEWHQVLSLIIAWLNLKMGKNANC